MNRKLVQGVGTNDAGYVVDLRENIGYINGKQKQKLIWSCPFYATWRTMLCRGYSEKLKARYPTYKDVSVCPEWHLFSTFKAWMETQDWEDKHLDKDILIPGNKVYSPKTCVFVTAQVNLFLGDCSASRGKYMIGCYWSKKSSKFMALCRNSFTGKSDYLGLFESELEAHQAWLKRKLELAYQLAALQSDERVSNALIERYENYRGK